MSGKFNLLSCWVKKVVGINPLNAKLNPICHLLALIGAHHILHVSGVRVKRSFRNFSSSFTKSTYSYMFNLVHLALRPFSLDENLTFC